MLWLQILLLSFSFAVSASEDKGYIVVTDTVEANSGSSDADIFGVNIIGTGKTDSVGILLKVMTTQSQISKQVLVMNVKMWFLQ